MLYIVVQISFTKLRTTLKALRLLVTMDLKVFWSLFQCQLWQLTRERHCLVMRRLQRSLRVQWVLRC